MDNPKVGARAVCHSCGESIVFAGPYWDHEGEMKPRHIAMPALPDQEQHPQHWTESFAGRELEEIKFARTYHQRYGHGTPGHSHLLIISQLSRQIDILNGRDPDWDREDW